MDLLAKRQKRNLLFDFYGSLLTKKQREIFTMHTVDDCSFTEIAREYDITPQAVSDNLKRATTQLEKYEKSLGLVTKLEGRANTISEIEAILGKLESLGWKEITTMAGTIRGHIADL